MQKVKVIIVEDESLVAADLNYQLLSLGYAVPGMAKSYTEALRACEMHQPDLVLMDIRIKGEKDGIDTAARIAELYEIPVIFLSDLKDPETLARALKTPSHSFLEKPVSEFNLKTHIEFAIEKHYARQLNPVEAENPLKDTLYVKADAGYIKILSTDILWVKANGAYCKVKTHKEELLLSKNMREFCDHLNPQVFIKIHKSHTINATKIDRFLGNVVTIDNVELQVGKSYLKSFKERLNIV
ncbi:MAG: hypothetical protein Roseis2KO_43830 [Roseivirga sp.]